MKTKKDKATPEKIQNDQPSQHPLLPKDYDGPAYQLKDGRVLYVGYYLNRVWAILYQQDGLGVFYHSVATQISCRDEASARDALRVYGETQKLTKIQ